MEKRRRIVAAAEHDPDDRVLLEKAFGECDPNIHIDFLDNGPDLLDYMWFRGKHEQSTSRPNIILMALDLPGKNAFEVMAEIKATPELKRIPLIVLTDALFENDLARCYDLGANTVITKPSDYDELVRIMKSVCEFWFNIASS